MRQTLTCHPTRASMAGRRRAAAPPSRMPTRRRIVGDGPHPTLKVGAKGATLYQVVLTGRATSMPFTAVLTGPERTTTDNATAVATSAAPCLRRSRARLISLGEQGVGVADAAIELSQAPQLGAQ